jgi:hypothetical protein
MQRRLVEMKAMLEQLDEAQGDSAADQRRQIKIFTALSQLIWLTAPDAKE